MVPMLTAERLIMQLQRQINSPQLETNPESLWGTTIPTKPQHADNEKAGGDSPVPGAQHNNKAL